MSIFSEEPNASTITAPITSAPSAGQTTTLPPKRSHASTSRPSSSAAKLDCESVVISPPQSTTSAAIVSASERGRLAQISTLASPIITSARKRPKMFGSKNSELTRKYSSTWLEAITFGFSSRCRVWNSQKPIAVKISASSDDRAAAPGQRPRRPVQPAQEREQQRERHVEEHDLLERLRAVLRVHGLHRVEHDPAHQHPLQRARALARLLAGVARRQPRDQPRQRARADHDVERDEQVRGAPARLDRDAERQRGQRGDAQHRRAGARTGRPARPSPPGRPRPRPAPARRGRARTPAAASSRSRPPAAPASARARRASPTPARARCGPAPRPRRAPPRPPCRRSAPRPGRPPCHPRAERILGRTPRRMSTMLCVTWLTLGSRRAAAATPAARRGSRCPCRA